MAGSTVYEQIKVGDTVGRWIVISPAEPKWYRSQTAKRARPAKQWLCRCQCDAKTERVVGDGALRRKSSNNCGCLTPELKREAAFGKAKTHGYSAGGKKRAEYKIWLQMRRRCSNPKDDRYPDYGARGIRVCPEWDASFEAFIRDMGERPSKDHSIDRRDNDGHYEPGNCRWATKDEQASNKRNNRYLTHNGLTLTIAEWTRRLGLGEMTIHQRLARGWPVERALQPLK